MGFSIADAHSARATLIIMSRFFAYLLCWSLVLFLVAPTLTRDTLRNAVASAPSV